MTCTMPPPSDTKVFLTNAIRRALSGEELVEAHIRDHIEEWPNQSQLEKSALVQLQNWTQDRQLRSQFAEHAEYNQRRLANLLRALEE